MTRRRCTCYVLPHEDGCGLFVGITQSGARVLDADPIGEACPTCGAVPGHGCRDTITGRSIGSAHAARARKAKRRRNARMLREYEEADAVRRRVSGAAGKR